MILLGISGKKRTGKNTVAKLLASLTNQSVKEFAFADELKLEVAKMLRVSVADIEQNKDLYRGMLQAVGVYYRNKFGEDYWVKKVFYKILVSNADINIITDVRFVNEAESVVRAGGKLVRVSRNTGMTDTHESETALDTFEQWDEIIINTGSMDDLLVDVKSMMNKLGIKLK